MRYYYLFIYIVFTSWGYPILPGHKLKAATNDWVFSPFLYLWEDEPYEDPGAWRRLEKYENCYNLKWIT